MLIDAGAERDSNVTAVRATRRGRSGPARALADLTPTEREGGSLALREWKIIMIASSDNYVVLPTCIDRERARTLTHGISGALKTGSNLAQAGAPADRNRTAPRPVISLVTPPAPLGRLASDNSVAPSKAEHLSPEPAGARAFSFIRILFIRGVAAAINHRNGAFTWYIFTYVHGPPRC
ncbi:hypothetical protein EVAR_70765_1 [Eumeta japonica]|uniref:Uncharacterized protein n=1 Tax=Eumeta variegata TaxID=151549 RepID=A0A4C2A266_EUMVA|nr:hypothetical protein EVAR_70765_1 [Eumeta japonica]